MPDGQGIKTDTNLNGDFANACSFAANVKLVKIPFGFDSPHITSNVNFGSQVKTGTGHNYETYLQNNSEGVNGQGIGIDIIDLSGNSGGDMDDAKKILEIMENRHTATIVGGGGVASAASIIAMHGDQSFIWEDAGGILTHETRLFLPENPVGEDNIRLSSIAKEFYPDHSFPLTIDFLQWFHDTLEGQGRTDDANFIKGYADIVDDYNKLMTSTIKKAHPNITEDCALRISSGGGDYIFDPEGAVKLGLMDAVILRSEEPGVAEHMLVRSSDPRAEKFRNEAPELFVELNPQEQTEKTDLTQVVRTITAATAHTP